MAWKQFMTYAHTGVQLKPIPFVEPPFETPAPGQAVAQGTAPGSPSVPTTALSLATSDELARIGRLMRDALAKPTASADTIGKVIVEAGNGAVPH
jgi:penicillin-binding protein 1A